VNIPRRCARSPFLQPCPTNIPFSPLQLISGVRIADPKLLCRAFRRQCQLLLVPCAHGTPNWFPHNHPLLQISTRCFYIYLESHTDIEMTANAPFRVSHTACPQSLARLQLILCSNSTALRRPGLIMYINPIPGRFGAKLSDIYISATQALRGYNI
jgi:hypothetical protein